MSAHTLIGANQVTALQEQLSVVTQKLQALEAKQAFAVKQTPAAPAAAANVVPPTPRVQWGNTPRVHLLRDLSVGPMDLASTSAWAVEIELLDTRNKQRGRIS